VSVENDAGVRELDLTGPVNKKVAIAGLCWLVYSVFTSEIEKILQPPTDLTEIHSVVDALARKAGRNEVRSWIIVQRHLDRLADKAGLCIYSLLPKLARECQPEACRTYMTRISKTRRISLL
jgi:hypothetical protein